MKTITPAPKRMVGISSLKHIKKEKNEWEKQLKRGNRIGYDLPILVLIDEYYGVYESEDAMAEYLYELDHNI